jgi:hypothetical protein
MGLGNSMLQMGMIYPGDTAFWLSIYKYKHDWQETISRYKGENKQIIKQDKKRNNVAEKKRENTNKTINTSKYIQVMIRNTDVIKTEGELSGLEG